MLSAIKETQDPINGSKTGRVASNLLGRRNYRKQVELDTWQCPGLRSLFT